MFWRSLRIVSVRQFVILTLRQDSAWKDFQAHIAILHLEPRMRFGDFVLPVCLPRDGVLEVDALRPGRVG